MRIWSVHPRYLDAKGLVALWREALLAKHVLQGKTRGYTHHPQLRRFRQLEHPVAAIDYYLSIVCGEAMERGYLFSRDKVNWSTGAVSTYVHSGQLIYETGHLLNKLALRDRERYDDLKNEKMLDPHPMFIIKPGPVEDWEIIREEPL